MALRPRLVLGFRAYPNPIHGTAGVFVVATTCREEGQVAKQAGMWFHGRRGECRMNPCFGCAAGVPYLSGYDQPAYWYRPADAKGLAGVQQLAEIADEAALAVLKPTIAAMEASRATDLTSYQQDIVVVESARADRRSYGYQRSGVASILTRKRAEGRGLILGDDMGLGKTAQVLLTLNSDPSIKTALVVCPSSLRLNWALECFMWLARPATIHVVDIKPRAPRSVRARAGVHTITMGPVPPADATIVIANFERARAKRVKKDGAVVLAADGTDALEATATSSALMARSWDLLVVDEAQRLRNPKALQTQAVFGRAAKKAVSAKGDKPAKPATAAVPGIAQNSAFLLLLTGTPIPNVVIELWPLLDAVAKDVFPKFWNFALRYCNAHKEQVSRDREAWIMDGSSNLPELQALLRSSGVMVRRLKTEVLPDLPSKTRATIVLTAEGNRIEKLLADQNAAWDAYGIDDMEAEADLLHASGDFDGYEEAEGRWRKAKAIAFEEMSAHRHAVGLAKVPGAVEHIEMLLETVSKVVVFAHHHDVIEKLIAGLSKYKSVKIDGTTSLTARQAAVTTFQDDPNCRLFFGNLKAAGVGITLTAAHTEVFVESSYVPEEMNQAEDRCVRIGQKNNVLIHRLAFEGSLDQRMFDIVAMKQAVADAALDTRRAAIVIPEIEAREPRTERVKPAAAVVDVNAPVEAREGTRMGSRRPAVYPVATDLQRDAAATAMRTLAGMDEDRAAELNGVGFSKSHTRIGHALAHLARPMTDGEVWLAAQLATIFRGQLSDELVAAAGGAVEA
jgi:SWI/SNF-related matrix-associated actin-dependent regulator of chromatin subfamily A-like protein 1